MNDPLLDETALNAAAVSQPSPAEIDPGEMALGELPLGELPLAETLTGSMPGSIACVECDGLVPAAAQTCPHCGAPDPRGLPCVVCRSPIRPSEAVYQADRGFDQGKFFHPTCFDRVSHSPRPCQACGVLVLASHLVTCPHCGAALAATACVFCGLALSPDLESFADRVLKVPIATDQGQVIEVWQDTARSGEAHRLCAEARPGQLRQDLYRDLYESLRLGNWRGADIATDRLVRYFASDRPFSEIPLIELQQIDNLWTSYSSGRFGYSVQTRLWLELGGFVARQTRPTTQPAPKAPNQRRPTGSSDGPLSELEEAFADRVGWLDVTALVEPVPDRLWLAARQVLHRAIDPNADLRIDLMPYDRLQFDPLAPEGHLPYPGADTQRDFAVGRAQSYTDRWDIPAIAARFATEI